MSRMIDTSGRTTLSEAQATARQGGKILFTTYNGQQSAFLIREDRLLAASLFPRAQSKIGAIYICKVKNAVRNLNSYFVEIGGEEREICFLSEKDATQPYLLNRSYDGRILEGDEFPVQVLRDAAKGKQASVTTRISLADSYFAASVGKSGVGYSSKLSPEDQAHIRRILDADAFVPPQNTGMVIRTRAAELLSDDSDFCRKLRDFTERWTRLFQIAEHRTCFTCLQEAPTPWEAVFEQLAYPDEYEEIVTDDRSLYDALVAAKFLPKDKTIRLYDERQSAQLTLTKLYGLESKMDNALNRRVWLKSGGYLVIEPTEALTVIDVNTGKNETGKAAEETYYRINREAAEEIALQLRLRNLSGIIIVDFINMKSGEQQEDLLQHLRSIVKSDRQKTLVVDMTPLGLVEITRKKSSKPLVEQLEAIKKPTRSGLWA